MPTWKTVHVQSCAWSHIIDLPLSACTPRAIFACYAYRPFTTRGTMTKALSLPVQQSKNYKQSPFDFIRHWPEGLYTGRAFVCMAGDISHTGTISPHCLTMPLWHGDCEYAGHDQILYKAPTVAYRWYSPLSTFVLPDWFGFTLAELVPPYTCSKLTYLSFNNLQAMAQAVSALRVTGTVLLGATELVLVALFAVAVAADESSINEMGCLLLHCAANLLVWANEVYIVLRRGRDPHDVAYIVISMVLVIITAS
ncbi:hypothetical protein BC835DRAFT_518451 [Cytidiella melzeri]|nr:hypothetical protein BC835DRAFT_518451 [Cytidiella melzeri]